MNRLAVQEAFRLFQSLTVEERREFLKGLDMKPGLLHGTRFAIIPQSMFDGLLGAVKESSKGAAKAAEMAMLLSQKLAKRNRRSSPRTIRRNVEICNLRQQNQKRWTQLALAKKYQLPKSSIQRILREEKKWRQLASDQEAPN